MILKFLKLIFEYFKNYIFTPKCLSCNEITIEANEFCSNCWYKFDFIVKPYCKLCGQKLEIFIIDNMICSRCFKKEPIYDISRSLLHFNQYSKRLIHDFKYNDKTYAARTLAKLLVLRYWSEMEDVDMIVSVPMNRFKRLFRKYNPSSVLAKEISKLVKIALVEQILIKSKWTKSQTSLSKKEREENVKNTIIFNKNYDILNKKILLVDDVITTGTTINQCALLLKEAGASSIYVMSIAMT
jgi:ComF family protein